MAKTIKSGWLKDYENNEFIPITHTTKVFDDSGISVESRLSSAETKLDTKLSLTEYGIEISENADLDTVTIPGTYQASSRTALSLLNCPTGRQFKLIVLAGRAENIIHQLLLVGALNNGLFYRTRVASSSSTGFTWCSWKQLDTDLTDFGITVSTEEINHLQNISSNIQEQLNNKSTVKIVRWS